ncbi:hypothetical protein [Xenophilus sp.]|uniref:hypothetical protein n=1 Tax=Xenophilus sp. TaxID=1873499 RepID=UPI0037DD892E
MPTALVAAFEWIGSALITGGAYEAGVFLIGSAATWAAATVLVGTLALSQYQRRKAERAARAQYDASQVDRLVNLPATTAPREVVLGRVRKGGTVFFRGTTGYFFNSHLFICIALAGHEIDGVEQIFFDDTPITLDENGLVMTPPWGGYTRRVSEQVTAPSQTFDLGHVPIGGTVKVFKNKGLVSGSVMNADGTVTYSGSPIDFSVAGSVITLSEWDTGLPWMPVTYRVIYEWTQNLSNAAVAIHLGGADQAADAGMMVAFPPGFWTVAHRARGVAYLVVQLKYDENAYPSGPPNVTALIRGAKCYDPRTGSTGFTENPALHQLYVLRHPQFGKRSLASFTTGELARIGAAASACDVATDYGQGPQPRFRASTVLPFGMAARDALDDLSQAMAGMWAYAAGEFYTRAGVWQSPVMSLTDEDLAVVQRTSDGSTSQTAMSIGVHRPRNEKINTIVARIWDQAANYVQTAMPPIRSDELVAADGAELSQEVVMPAVFFWPQAHHIASVMLRDARDPLTAVLPFKLKAYPLDLFDSVWLTLSRYGWSAKEFIILGRTFTPEGMVVLTLKETSSAIYAQGAPVLAGGYADNTQLPSPWNITPPTITKVESGESVLIIQGDGTIVNGVRVTWSALDNPAVTNGGSIEVQWRAVGVDAWQSVVVSGSATSALLAGAADLQWITIRVRAKSSLAISDWSPQLLHQVIGKSAPPPDMLGLSVSGSVLSWSMPYLPPDLAGYVFRFHYGGNADWNSAAPLHTGILTESPYDLVTRPGGVVTIMGKAIDTTGNVSDQAAAVVMNLGDPPIANVLEVWDFDAMGWPAEPGEQSGWSLVGGLPSADALDSFYGQDDQSFYRGNSESFYKDESYAELVYVTESVSVNSALAGSVMTLWCEAQGVDLTIDYRLSSPGPFYGEDDQSLYGQDDNAPLYGEPGAWQPWPGQLVAANDGYQFRVRLGAGAQQGVLESLVMVIDAPDIEEEIADAPVPAGGLVIPYTKQFTAIKTIQVTLQANASGAVTAEIDKTLPLAPVVRAFNASHAAVSGATVDITLKGY